MLRTHKCNELTRKNIWEQVKLSGWVSTRRDHGGIIFIDLRDRYGLTQTVFDPENDKNSYILAESFRSEYVIQVEWTVRARPKGQENSHIVTGEIEIITNKVSLLSKSKTPPFELDTYGSTANEEIRYKHRYIDLRRKYVLDNVIFRSKFLNFTRNWFANRDFLEVQTPIFTASSPEWARDFLVPSRLHPGKFYALPQAPQQYKQLLMVGWIDKYIQIAPCFRDEDPRADRHACEFYQIDCEMSFVEQADIFKVVEAFMFDTVEELSDKKILESKFFHISYKESMDTYGTDKPDLRFWMKFIDLTDTFKDSWFWVFKNVATSTNWAIKAIKLEWQSMSRKDIDELTKVAEEVGAAGLAYIIYDVEWPRSPILKFFSEWELSELEKRMNPKTWDIIFFSANTWEKAVSILSVVRLALRDKFSLADKNLLSFCWITDFPMFEENEITWKIDFGHNPFSMPKWWIKAFEKENLLEVESVQYDLACNGYEILSGSIRNHDVEALVKAFEKVGRTSEEVKEKFWAMYEAFQYWPPPHGWFAIWMDRFIMILKDETNIREVYAFPKSWKAQDTMMNSPTSVDDSQLDELHIQITEEKE
jgi:aspartyl-tRNA synthetase